MRHLVGFGLAIVMALAVFFAATWGYVRLLRIPVLNGATTTLPAGGGTLLHNGSVLEAFAALAGTGLLAGILIAVRRVSPLAAGLPGLVLVLWSLLYLVRVHRAVQYIPLKSHTYGYGFEAMLFNGVLAFAGLVMIVPLFMRSRWQEGRPAYEEADHGGRPGSNVGLLSDWGETAPLPQQEPPLYRPQEPPLYRPGEPPL